MLMRELENADNENEHNKKKECQFHIEPSLYWSAGRDGRGPDASDVTTASFVILSWITAHRDMMGVSKRNTW